MHSTIRAKFWHMLLTHLLQPTSSDNPNCINVFICADRADRIKRIAERYDVSEKKALDRIKRMDRERKYYYETHTGQEWGSISSHEILLNASLLGIEGTVDILEGIYKR